jgi:hypothetical protein
VTQTTVLVGFHRTEGNRDWLNQALASFPEDTPRMVLENEGYSEWIRACNQAFEQATTPYVLVFGHDDVALPGFLEPMQNLAESGIGADVVYPSMVLTNEDLEPIRDYSAQMFCGNRLAHWNYIPACSLIRRTKAIEVGGYRDVPIQDWDLWVRLHQAGARFKPCPEAQMLYRQRPDSLNRKIEQHTAEEMYTAHGITPPDVAATFYHQATPATTYLRCQLPARHLPGVCKSIGDLMLEDDGDHVRFPEQHGQTAVIQFGGDKASAFFTLHLRNSGYRVLIETDDNYTARFPDKRVFARSGWTERIGEGVHSIQGHRWIVQQADGVLVTTPWLADRYRKLNPNVHVAPNSVDPADWPEPVKPDDGILRLVWFASLSHDRDIPLISPAFEWAAGQKDVEVTVFGLNPRWLRFPWKYGPWAADLDAYRWHFHHFDVGVAPIVEDQMGMGRSDIKGLEYAMGGVAPILSELAPYAAWTDGENCLKARTAADFKRAVKHLVRNPGEAKQLAAAARAYVLAERTTAAQIDKWKEACDVTASSRAA